ncbi:DNA mismatch repair protein MLH3 isoform X3 [Physcomitrium patens]|uniref:DNA mismatch repair protein MLH3 isoform X3 n=1 Tax=Physcomitrium patens TaxID=3218 RepID=UPI000D154F28|nr:DNA mismatch repair protein MLH3-like isoform X3 [Physcomitrium patens]|eukprot:XP_024392916.1 DNA mismatch repair protein MLH3-like isoform X3 [Physcomitrella patens]
MGRIGRLSAAVVSHLRSNTVVSSFEQAVEELICNSLDAGATQVRVQFDGGGASVKVEDDGHGMSREDLELVGLRHATSKLHTLDELAAGVQTLGFRGEALSSLSDLSILEITSRVQGCPHTYCKIMKGSNTVSLGLSSQQRSRGTTVTLRDMFYNQPVRRRLFHSSSRKILQSVKERIVRLALAYFNVTFILTDSLRVEEELHIRRHTSLYSTLQDVFGREFCHGLKEIDFAKGKLRLTGFLSSTETYTSLKAVQYLYINHRFVYKTPLHKLINRWGKNNARSAGGEPKRIEKLDTSLGKAAYPAFVLNLSCELSEYDITFEATKTYVEFKDWTPALTFLENVLCVSWGDEAEKRQATHASGKRKSWYTNGSGNETEITLRRKRARTHTVNESISAGLLQADSITVPELGCKSFEKERNKDTGEYIGGDRFSNYHHKSYLESETFRTPSWGQLAKPGHVNEEESWLDQEMNTPLRMSMNRALAHPLLDRPSPDVLLMGIPKMQDISMASSPILSEGSWDGRFSVSQGVDDFPEEVNTEKDQDIDCGQLQSPKHSLDSSESDIFLDMPRPLRTKKPSNSPPIMERDSGSLIPSMGGNLNEWALPAVTSSMDVSLLPSGSWNDLDPDKPRGSPNTEDVTAYYFSDDEEVHPHSDLHMWSDRLERSDHGVSLVDDFTPEICREWNSSRNSPSACNTDHLAKVGKVHGRVLQGITSIEEVDNIVQEHLCQQAEWTCTSPAVAPDHDLVLPKSRPTEKESIHRDVDVTPVASLYEVWSNPCMRANTNDILHVSAVTLKSWSKSLQPDMVTKKSLQHARVLQQVDNKFIAIVAQNVLLLVDQHAADERVQLEEFRTQVLAAGKQQCSTLLDVKHDLSLGLGEQQTLHAYRQQIEDWGWRFCTASDARSLDRTSIRGCDSTTCKLQLSAVPCILGVNLTASDLEEYLQQLGATQGASVPPPAVIRLLNYKSCRGAIMFGDPLLPAQCRQLVSHLKHTSLCFQCAHGRPTMVPLVNLQILRQRTESQMTNDGFITTNTSRGNIPTASGACWHKLMKHPLSLERARERLH